MHDTPIESLSVSNLTVGYGSARAIFDVSFSLEQGQILAVLGTNGAGKTSLARALSGLVRPQSGSILFDNEDITGWPAHQIRKRGITYLPEGRGVFPGLSVTDNLRMGVRWLGSNSEQHAGIERAFALFPILAARKDQRAGTLSGGEQQMLSLARGLAVRPRLLIADELSSGLAPKIVDAVFASLDESRKSGITIVLIEQFVHRALAFADRALILRRGQVVWHGETEMAKREVLARYLGDSVNI